MPTGCCWFLAGRYVLPLSCRFHWSFARKINLMTITIDIYETLGSFRCLLTAFPFNWSLQYSKTCYNATLIQPHPQHNASLLSINQVLWTQLQIEGFHKECHKWQSPGKYGFYMASFLILSEHGLCVHVGRALQYHPPCAHQFDQCERQVSDHNDGSMEWYHSRTHSFAVHRMWIEYEHCMAHQGIRRSKYHLQDLSPSATCPVHSTRLYIFHMQKC